MAARLEVTRPGPAPPDTDSPGTGGNAAAATAGIAYGERCLRGHRPFAIATGSSRVMAAFLALAVDRWEAREDLHLVRVTTPTDSVQSFLGTCLAQLGFELFQAGLDDLHNLLVVFLRHEGARGRRTVVIIEATEHYGPRVLEFMQTLSRIRGGATPAITFVLTGSQDLHRVLDSPGMTGLRQFTRERFNLDRSLAWVAPGDKHATALQPAFPRKPVELVPDLTRNAPDRRLVVMEDGAIIERRSLVPGKLVIGRSPRSGLCLASRYVSRHHAMLVVAPDHVTVVDLGSTNSTLVNGQAVTSWKLEHGDLVAIGNYRLRYDCRPGRVGV